MKTWKQSKDPKFREKARRLRALMNREHNPPVVVAVDEMGPISLKPYGGRTWARSGHPDRVRATYKRTMGVRHLMGMYDYFHKVLRGYLSPRKSGANWVRFLRYVRRWYPPSERIYLIQDNLSTHTTPEALREARRLEDLPRADPDELLAHEPDRDPLPLDPSDGPYGVGLPRVAAARQRDPDGDARVEQ